MSTSTPPASTRTSLLPTIRNLDEARESCAGFSSVLTVGPEEYEVHDFGHPDHKVVSFDDVTYDFDGFRAPTFDLVVEAVEWGANRPNLLVHCHAGMSRSTSTAWGIAIVNGFDPQEAYDLLKQRHPVVRHRAWATGGPERSYLGRRAFIPNELIVKHLERYLGFRRGTLLDIATIGARNDVDLGEEES